MELEAEHDDADANGDLGKLRLPLSYSSLPEDRFLTKTRP